ncbi:AMP-binding protein [Paraglaciecola sp. 2405UD69-4]|uniref:AMP-binding protein n=1 Tax=Paraglaciecola sp. 2405UD69-4 TaxID=3391836 RepID=UPI0039C9DDD3
MTPTFFTLKSSQVCFVGSEQSASKWAGIVDKYQRLFSAHPAKKWLLSESDSFVFSALFYALLSSGKSVVLPQNSQPEHIKHVKLSVDASVGPEFISPTFTSDIDCLPVAELTLTISAEAEVYFYTSGSTGTPKIIIKPYKLLHREVDALESKFHAYVKETVFVSTVPHQHIYGLLYKILWPINKGHAFVPQAYEYPEQMATQIAADSCMAATIISSPAQLQRMVADNPLAAVKAKVRNIFSSGGPLDANKNVALQQALQCQLIEVFGSTETGGIGWRARQSLSDEDWHVFNEVKISYQQGSDLLAISSSYISEPLYNADDRVQILDDYRFRVLGRADSVVKIEEKRVSLDEVQNRLKQHPFIDDAFVVVIGTERRKLAALIVLNEEGNQASQGWKKMELDKLFKGFLSNWYEAVLVPKKYRYPIELPYNARGKLSRREAESYFE